MNNNFISSFRIYCYCLLLWHSHALSYIHKKMSSFFTWYMLYNKLRRMAALIKILIFSFMYIWAQNHRSITRRLLNWIKQLESGSFTVAVDSAFELFHKMLIFFLLILSFSTIKRERWTGYVERDLHAFLCYRISKERTNTLEKMKRRGSRGKTEESEMTWRWN